MSGYRVPFADTETEFTEKRSRFITNLWRVETEAEARAKIEEIRKRHYDARHHCWCYLLREGGVVRYSDDAAQEGVLRDADYGAEVTLHAAFSQEGAAAFAQRLTELSAGKLEMIPAGEEYLPGPRESL